MIRNLTGIDLLRPIFGSVVDTTVFQRRLGLIGLALGASAVAGVGGFDAHRLVAERAELIADGAAATGRIIGKHENFRGRSVSHELTVEYIDPDLGRHRKIESVSFGDYRGYAIGSTVSVKYVKSRLDAFYIEGYEPTLDRIHRMNNLFFAGLAGLTIATAMSAIFWGGAGSGARGVGKGRSSRPLGAATRSGARGPFNPRSW